MSKYEKFSKEELLALVEKQDNELSSKKYGLVWDSEREPEQVVLDCEHNLPVLKRVKGKEIKESKDQEDNILIEGDNYHALTVLNYTHQEKVDVIYIDPPYNTGSGDFKYNDKWVNDEDSYRHSKWLSFMSKRLNLAKNLLKESGIILIQIDDNEIAQLKMLMDKIFGEDNFRSNIIWAYRTGGAPSKKDIFSKKHDYILCYSKNRDLFHFNKLKEKIRYEKNFFGAKKDDEGNFYADVNLRDFIEGEFTLMKNVLVYKTINVKPVLNLSSERVENFSSQKPKGLMKFLLEVLAPQNGIVLDFFAGSGSTAYSVLEINKEEDKKLKFILCTNNENNICEEFTHPRLKNIIKGYKKIEGLGGNLQYFRTDLIKQTKNKDQMRLDLTQRCTEMLCVKENIFNLEIEKEDYKIFSSNRGDKFMCVYYNLFDESFKDFFKEIKKLKGEKKIYIFSIDGRVDRKLFTGVEDCDIEEIPQKIIEVYKQLVKMNIPIKAGTIFLEFEKANKKIFTKKEKDEGARILRIVLEKTIQKIAQKNNISILKDNHKEEKIAVLNDKLKENKIFNQIKWEENKTYLTIGNNASHGDYDEYALAQVENFYRHIQSLFNDFGI